MRCFTANPVAGTITVGIQITETGFIDLGPTGAMFASTLVKPYPGIVKSDRLINYFDAFNCDLVLVLGKNADAFEVGPEGAEPFSRRAAHLEASGGRGVLVTLEPDASVDILFYDDFTYKAAILKRPAGTDMPELSKPRNV